MREELEHVGSDDAGSFDRLKIFRSRSGPQRVRPSAAGDELQIRIDQRITQRILHRETETDLSNEGK